MIIESISGSLVKALSSNSQATEYSTSIRPLNGPPDEDGLFDAGNNPSIFLLPYAEAPIGSRFTMRIYGWRPSPSVDVHEAVWIPYILAEFMCMAGGYPGPQGPAKVRDTRDVLESERFCDVIVQRRGFAASVSEAGGGVIASAYVGLGGCKKFQFDFMQISPNMSVNCLWSKA